MHKKPNYKKANEDLLKFLESVPEPKASLENNRIIDLTEDLVGTVYQFTDNDLLVIKGTSKGDNNETKRNKS